MEYTRQRDKLNAECPEKLQDVLGHQFIAGLDDKEKVDLVQVYLRGQQIGYQLRGCETSSRKCRSTVW